jgi:glucosamine-6-phosphate deaminase
MGQKAQSFPQGSYQEKGKTFPVFKPLLRVYQTQAQAEAAAANVIAAQVRKKPQAKLALPTGNTWPNVYGLLGQTCKKGLDFSQITTFNLDEYWPIAPSHPGSYRHYMKVNWLNQVNLPLSHFHIPNGAAPDPELEALNYEASIRQAGNIDLAVLSFGPSGKGAVHIGFNEPGPDSHRLSRTRLVTLSAETILVNSRLFREKAAMPSQALTMGIATMLSAKKLLVLAVGAGKAKGAKNILEGPIGWHCPASYIRTHPQVRLILDQAAARYL